MVTGKLVVLGSVNIDHILDVEHFPRPGETVTGGQYRASFGGKGSNQAIAAARSGADIAFIACVGDDAAGAEIRTQLALDHIDSRAVEVVTGVPTGAALIFVNRDGENFIGISAGANAALTPERLAQSQEIVTQADALLLQLETPLETIEAAVHLARQHGVSVVLNPAPARDLPEALLAEIDILTPNETEVEYLSGVTARDEAGVRQAADALHRKGVKTVLITLGHRGAWLSQQGTGTFVPAFEVNAIDTTAAGDVFNGAFLTAVLEGQTSIEAVRFAHAAAALAVQQKGAHPSIPWRQDVDAFLRSQRP